MVMDRVFGRDRYNHEHKQRGLQFMTPHQRHSGQTDQVMDNRKAVYEAARIINPKRWSRNIRDWNLPEQVWLNPEKNADDIGVAA